MTEMNQEIIVPENKIVTSSTGDAIDLSGEINFYHQTTSDNCAGTCACMCVKKSPSSYDSSTLYPAQWGLIAQGTGYSLLVTPTPSSLGGLHYITLKDMYDTYLSSYLPVMAKINTDSKEHWVVIFRFIGGDTNDPNNYWCADPSKITDSYGRDKKNWTQLPLATYYGCTNSTIFNYGVYKKD